MKKIFYSAAIMLATATAVNAQEVDISWDNVTYSDNTFSFDVVFAPGSGYGPTTSMDAANLRFLITSSTDLTVEDVEATDFAVGYDAEGVVLSPAPDPMPENSDNFAVTVLRLGTDLLLPPAGSPFTVTTVTVTMSDVIPADAYFSLLPALPAGETSGPYTFWSYGDGTGQAPFVGDGIVPLPVEFISFTAQKSNAQALLTWATAKEQNNIGFDVERSADGKNFTKIGHVATKATDGHSSAKLSYNFNDAKPANGVNYYRLKQHDIDGKFAYSTIASVTFGSEQAINMYPNPTENQLTVDGINAGNVLRVIDVNGKIVSELTAGSAIETFNLSNLASGIYSMQVISDGAVIKTTQISKK